MQLDINKDLDALTLTVVATFDHPVEEVWDLYADPRKLERWWGPPTYPATVVEHDLTAGGTVHYYMTSPEGEQHHGRWDVLEVDAPTSFSILDKFADADGNPADGMPEATMRLSIAGTSGGAQMTAVTTYASREALDQVLAMGMEEGLRTSMAQMDGVLAGA
ncbi:SRPBCC family protein [Aeromicrobium wangtongii]|uniref:SRPBCC family protein n=1 Tax=Aeromicrobium wangtongii TaxID=2969247 RepID=UPI002016BFCA|nr:SRPBCC domain-containing protein [Aeromicrobium wangtongii]MCL3819124.1 SRPBCC domain-containing protein [Aeromicrobium wangtongii]